MKMQNPATDTVGGQRPLITEIARVIERSVTVAAEARGGLLVPVYSERQRN